MTTTGGCYCGQVRYESTGEPLMKAECHCRECQYITGGGPNFFMAVPAAGFTFTQGETRAFTRSDLESAVTREFCPNCGTGILTRSPALPDAVILKVGSMDDPAQYGGPDVAIFTCDMQSFHCIPEGLPSFERLPG